MGNTKSKNLENINPFSSHSNNQAASNADVDAGYDPFNLNSTSHFELKRSKNDKKRLAELDSQFPPLITIPDEIVFNSKEFKKVEPTILKKLSIFPGFDKISDRDMKNKMAELICSEVMLQSYLSEYMIGTEKILDLISEDTEEYKDDLSFINETVNHNYIITEKYLKIKFVVVEIDNTTAKRVIRNVLSPFLTGFNMAPEFGLFHTAIIVGPFYLEWNDSGICIPRKCTSNTAVIASDLSTELIGPHVTISLNRLARIICHWNAYKIYNRTDNNCQVFVEELCKGLGFDLIQKYKNSSLGLFLQKMKKVGNCELKFYVNNELHQKCPWIKAEYGNSIKFKSHAELDDFYRRVDKSTNFSYFTYTAQGKDDHALLKSFDRAFWLRFRSSNKVASNSDNFAPHSEGCCFGDPDKTGSITSFMFTQSDLKKRY